MNSAENNSYHLIEKTALGEEIYLISAPLLHRMMAWIVDLTTVLFLQTVISLFLAAKNMERYFAADADTPATGAAIAFFILLSYVVQVFFYFYFEYAQAGRTPGKRLLSLRVVSHTGGRPSLQAILWRCLLRPIEAGFLPIIAAITAFSRQDNRRIGDILAGTLVIIDLADHRGMSQAKIVNTNNIDKIKKIVSQVQNLLPPAKLNALRELAKIYPHLTPQHRLWFSRQVAPWLPPEAASVPLEDILFLV